MKNKGWLLIATAGMAFRSRSILLVAMTCECLCLLADGVSSTNGIAITASQKREFVIKMLTQDLKKASGMVKEYELELKTVKSDLSYYGDRWKEADDETAKFTTTTVYDVIDGHQIVRTVKTAVPRHKILWQKMNKFFSSEYNSSHADDIFKAYYGESATLFRQHFKDEYTEADKDYNCVTRKLDDLNDAKARELVALYTKYSFGRNRRLKEIVEEVKSLENERKKIMELHMRNGCRATGSMGKRKTCACESQCHALAEKILSLTSEMTSYKIVDNENKEIRETANVEMKYDREIQKVQKDYTHQVHMTEIVKRYQDVIEVTVPKIMEKKLCEAETNLARRKKKILVLTNLIENPIVLDESTIDAFFSYYKNVWIKVLVGDEEDSFDIKEMIERGRNSVKVDVDGQ